MDAAAAVDLGEPGQRTVAVLTAQLGRWTAERCRLTEQQGSKLRHGQLA
jgi:hypothetical protein